MGAAANLVLIPADSAVDALARQPIRPYVIRQGQILVHNQVQTTYGRRCQTSSRQREDVR